MLAIEHSGTQLATRNLQHVSVSQVVEAAEKWMLTFVLEMWLRMRISNKA